MAKKVVKLSSLRVDLAKESEGEWISSQRYAGVRWLLRSTNLPEYVAAAAAGMRKLAEQTRKDGEDLDAKKYYAMRVELLLEHILRGWSGMDVEYSADVARDELRDVAMRDVTEDILICADQVGRAQIETLSIDEKN